MDPNFASPYEVLSVPVNAIHQHEWTLIERLNDSSIDEIARSMSFVGLMQPIRVATHDGNTYKLVYGARRLAAARRLGWSLIPACVCDWDNAQCAAAALAENVQFKPLSFLQMSEAIEAGVRLQYLTRTSLHDMLGKSQDFLNKIAEIANFSLDVQFMLQAAPWTIWCAAKIDRIVDQDRRTLLIGNAISHTLTADQVDAESHEPPDSHAFDGNAFRQTTDGAVVEQVPDIDLSESRTQELDIDSNREFDPGWPAVQPQSHVQFLMTELVRIIPYFDVPESLDDQIDLIETVGDTIAHLLYVCRLIRPTMTLTDMMRDAINRASELPFKWFD